MIDNVTAIDKVAVMLISGVNRPDAREAAQQKLGLTEQQADRALQAAQKKITLAADFNRVEEIGQAYMRLNHIYARALRAQDCKTALSAQRELHNLMSLYDGQRPAGAEAGDGPEASDARAARAHLAALDLGPADASLAELARLAVAKIVALEGDE
ncbi:MAG: hypothetical protein ACOC46_03065 [Pirellulales bacterium]